MTYKIRINQYKLDIDSIFVYAFFAITLYLYLFQYNRIVSYIQLLLLAVGAIRGYIVCIKQKFIFPVGLGLFFLLCWLFCLIMFSFFQPTHGFDFSSIVYTVCYIGLSILLLKKSFGLWGSGLLLIICAGIIIVRMLLGADPQDIVLSASRNYVSVIMLFCILLYYLALYQSGKRGVLLVLLPAAIFFVICIVAYGRGGILTSGFLLSLLCIYKLLNVFNKQAGKRLCILILIAIALIMTYLFLSQRITLTIGNFSRGMVSTSRLEIWATFFKNNTNSVIDFICGSDSVVIGHNGNLHNSFLQCYEMYGIVAFCVLIVLSVKAVIDGIRHRDFFWTILILTLFLRAFTDLLFYKYYCELFLYYFLMFWQYKKRCSEQEDITKIYDSNYEEGIIHL